MIDPFGLVVAAEFSVVTTLFDAWCDCISSKALMSVAL